MATKKTAKTVSTKSSAVKSRVSSSPVLKSAKKRDWRILAVLIAVFAVALGYLFVRLSKASNEVLCTGPWMKVNCYRQPNDPNAFQGNGTILNKQDGTTSWTGGSGSYVAWNDRVHGGIAVTYCVNVKFNSTTKWKLTWTNRTSGGSMDRSGTDGTTNQSDQQTVKCLNRGVVNGSGDQAQLNEIKFEVESGSAIIYKMVRNWQGTEVIQNTPAPLKPAPAPSVSSTPPPVQLSLEDRCKTQVMGNGSQGECVTLIQRKLYEKGYTNDAASIDNFYGSNTTELVKLFQKKVGLAQDGAVGPNTWPQLLDPNAGSKK